MRTLVLSMLLQFDDQWQLKLGGVVSPAALPLLITRLEARIRAIRIAPVRVALMPSCVATAGNNIKDAKARPVPSIMVLAGGLWVLAGASALVWVILDASSGFQEKLPAQ